MSATSLPPTCGEVMNVPGIPCVGCVSVLHYNTHTATGFSCCVIASQEEVCVLGPDMHRGGGALTSVQLWRIKSQRKTAQITSLVAFLLTPPTLSSSSLSPSPPPPRSSEEMGEESVIIDEVCAVVSWEEQNEEESEPNYHITALFFPLVRTLLSEEDVPVVVKETSFLHERGQQRVFRLFYHPQFSMNFSEGIHVVLCSCYNEQAEKENLLSHSEERNRHVLTPGDSRGVFSGAFSFLVCSSTAGEYSRWEVAWHHTPPACVASWMVRSPCNGVICSVAVQQQQKQQKQEREEQQQTSHVMCAMGTTNGRVVLLRADGSSSTHRYGGPIVDLAFVHTGSMHGDERYRNRIVTELLQQQSLQKTACTTSAFTLKNTQCEKKSMTLVILDALGRVILLHSVNNNKPNVRVVPDIQQFITLPGNGISLGINSIDNHVTKEPVVDGSVAISSKNFFDISSLRLFFLRRKTKDVRHELRERTVSHISTSDSGVIQRPVRDNAFLAGHVLSRGLLCLATTAGPWGRVELMVSTMGQSIVSIPFDKNDGTFSIAGFVVTPEPMFFVGLVDFYNTGVEELVMAGRYHILVANRSRQQQKAKAALLLRLLSKAE
ncbi:uncharacterized protein TM35_000042190 [Trypanosoma theileri]|uniref:Uncharacterized protein n=1 Tax=Trypanosoma theileri TaxID=67003 RepID=A0A1X0P552_9TRYP|nr:uncharacterized protein TM35_000042190 [Trypanosoma theileri]ORC92005.1 hypothetical protein TM35_000042190 [Trypanosoma theileri]